MVAGMSGQYVVDLLVLMQPGICYCFYWHLHSLFLFYFVYFGHLVPPSYEIKNTDLSQ